MADLFDNPMGLEGFEFVEDVAQARSQAYHGVVDARQARDEWRNAAAWVDQRGEFILDAVAFELDRRDLDDGVTVLFQSRGLNINGNDGCHNRTSVP